MMKTRIIFSFKSKRQMPLFMVIKEYYDDNGDIEFAKVLFEIKGRAMRKLEKRLGIPNRCWKYKLAMHFIQDTRIVPNCCVGCKWAKNNQCTKGVTK